MAEFDREEEPVRLVFACCSLLIGMALSGCESAAPAPPPPPDLAPTIGNGAGSQFGNYTAQTDGESRGPSGEPCVVYNWDRPLTTGLALRLRSASCESAEHPGRMNAHEISRTIIPMSESNLKIEPDEAR